VTAHADLIHAAAIWLERHDAPASCVVVVGLWPASLGLWRPGAAAVGVQAGIDDAAAEVLEAAAPWVARALDEAGAVEAAIGAVLSGGKLQVLVVPAEGTAALRLVRDGAEPVTIAGTLAPAGGDLQTLH
jgi:hypothetical protein